MTSTAATPNWLTLLVDHPTFLDVLWKDPPPIAVTGRKGKRWSSTKRRCGSTAGLSSHARARVTAALRSRPGQWAQVQFRGHLDPPSFRSWLGANGFEVTQRTEDGNHTVYARWIPHPSQKLT